MVNNKQVKMNFWKDIYLASIRSGSTLSAAKINADKAVKDLTDTFLKDE